MEKTLANGSWGYVVAYREYGQYHGRRFLVQLCYRAPQMEFDMILVAIHRLHNPAGPLITIVPISFSVFVSIGFTARHAQSTLELRSIQFPFDSPLSAII